MLKISTATGHTVHFISPANSTALVVAQRMGSFVDFVGVSRLWEDLSNPCLPRCRREARRGWTASVSKADLPFSSQSWGGHRTGASWVPEAGGCCAAPGNLETSPHPSCAERVTCIGQHHRLPAHRVIRKSGTHTASTFEGTWFAGLCPNPQPS